MGAYIDSCYVHEQNVNYCSDQNQWPNCVGWSPQESGSKKWGYKTSVQGMTPQQAFTEYYFGEFDGDESTVGGRRSTVLIDAARLQANPACVYTGFLPSAAASRRLRVRGRHVYEEPEEEEEEEEKVGGAGQHAVSTKSVRLRGFNFDFKLGSDYAYPDELDARIAELAPDTTLLRFVMNHWHDSGSKSDCAYGATAATSFLRQECLEQFDRILSWANATLPGAWSVVTARSALAAGDGGSGATIFTNDTLKSEWLAMWTSVAARYAGRDNVAGYEIMSEPRTDASAEHVHALQLEACAAVWSADARAICFVGAAKFYDRYALNRTYVIPPSARGGVVYLANFFEPKVWINSISTGNTVPYGGDFPCSAVTPHVQMKRTCGSFHSTKNVTVNRAWLAAQLEVLSGFSAEFDAPVWIDQFGVRASDPGGAVVQAQYLDDVLAEFEEREFHWTYWIWRRTRDWGVGGYAIERESKDGEHSVFDVALDGLNRVLSTRESA